MKQFEHDDILINDRKLLKYLLDITHRMGMHKARFFIRFGFTKAQHTDLKEALIEHVLVNQTSSIIRTYFGIKITKDCSIKTPDDRNPYIRTVWFKKNGQNSLNFVTAYPIKR